jgi:hypothetical protein
MSRARRSVSDKDIRQYEQFMAKMKADASAAGSGNFNFDDDSVSSKKDGEDGADGKGDENDDLYG